MNRYYGVEIILNDKKTVKKVETFCNKNSYEFYYIYHNKFSDYELFKSKGKEKKHYHFQIYFYNNDLKPKQNIDFFASSLNIKCNFFELIKSKRKAIQYLVHKNNCEKYQFNVCDIKTNCQSNILNYFPELKESTQAIKIINYIKKHKMCSYYDLVRYCTKKNLYSTLRRNQYLFTNLKKDIDSSLF